MKLEKILFVTPYVGEDTPLSMCFAKLLMGKIQMEGIKVKNIPVSKTINPALLIRQIKSLRSMTKSFEPDLVVANFGTYTGLLVAISVSVPRVVIYRGSDLNPSPSESWLYQFLQHAASHCASFLVDGIICVSYELANRLWVDKPCLISPDPTSLDIFRPMNSDNCRAKLGWDLNKPVAIFVGYGGRKGKGLEMARKVQQEITDNCGEVQLKLLIDRIPLEQMPIYLNAADCLLFLSDFEGSPNLIRDACACNLPIVTVPVGDVREVLKDVVPSKIVDRNIDTITEQVINITKLRKRTNGREHVLKYSPSVIASKHIDFYSSFLNK